MTPRSQSFDASAFLRRFDAMDRALVAAGFPATSPWWRRQLERFFRALEGTRNPQSQSARVRQFVLRVGRRGGKSSTLCRVAVCWSLWGTHKVPPGDVGVVAFVSVSRDESSQRLRTLEAILTALGVQYRRQGDSLELEGNPVVFKTFAASIAGVSGFTAILFIGDEVSKWRDSDTGANPASEVLASARPTLATQPFAPLFLCSSPLGLLDAHAKAFELGDTGAQLVAHAETWVANDSLTEADCRALEPDPRIFDREYRAVPQASASGAFDPDAVARAFRAVPPVADTAQTVCIVDASSGGGDAFAYALVSYVTPLVSHVEQFLQRSVPRTVHTMIDGERKVFQDPNDCYLEPVRDTRGSLVLNPEYLQATRPTLVFWQVKAFEGRFAGQISGSRIVDQIARDCRMARVQTVLGDQREAFFLGSEFMRHRLTFRELTWSNSTKMEAVTRLKRMFAEDAIVLPVGREKLRRELLNYAERITPSGSITYSARGSGHDDEAALLITAAMGELERLIPGSPISPHNIRHQVSGRG